MLGRGCATGLEGHQVGDRVSHYRDPSNEGTIHTVEENGLSVLVVWDGDTEPDFQWSNKVIKLTATTG